jgi:hypothetical protein
VHERSKPAARVLRWGKGHPSGHIVAAVVAAQRPESRKTERDLTTAVDADAASHQTFRVPEKAHRGPAG